MTSSQQNNVCPPEHKHGEISTCYIQHKCRCDDCRTQSTVRAAKRRKLQAYGRWDDGLVDAEPVRQHVRMLQAAGMGWKRIAEVSGVGNTAVSQLIYGRKGSNKDPRKGEIVKRIKREKAEKLLAVKPELENLRAGAVIDSRGFRRRVEALMCVGWSMSKQAKAIGVNRRNFGLMMTRSQVTVKHHLVMVDLFDRWWNAEPLRGNKFDLIAYNRTRNLARARKYVPPLGWDDIDLDDAPAVADGVVTREEEIEFMLGLGVSVDNIAEALSVSLSGLERYLYRHGRNDLAVIVHNKS